MRPERLRELDDVLDEALGLPEDEREAFLERRLADDPELRVEALSLLAAEARAAFLDLPVIDPARVGPYRVLRRIGAGGSGIVYEAIRDGPDAAPRALKVQRASFEGGGRANVFEREVAALSRLRHPAIAQIHETGRTPDGRQFLAMELVRGLPLTEHARAHGLDLRARLTLFAAVCDAMHWAHLQRIAHGDLKPANVLVDGDGRPRIVDFGLARLAGDGVDTTFTDFGVLAGTLPYLSPEQAAGSGADARTDVYALGVILHELAADRLPFDFRGLPPHEALRRIREEEPPAVRAHAPALPRALGWVLRKAMAKDPRRRYAGADALAEDVRRFLAGARVAARPESARERARRLWRLHPRAASAGVALALGLSLAGAVVWMQRRALRDEARRASDAEMAAGESAESARLEAAKAREILSFIERALDSTRPDAGQGRRITLRDFLDETAAGLARGFEGQPAARAGLHAAMGSAYLSLGLAGEAEPHLRAHLEHERAASATTHAPRKLAEAHLKLATALERQGRYAEALTQVEDGAAFLGEQAGAEDLRARMLLAEGRLLLGLGRDADAEERLSAASGLAAALPREGEPAAVEAAHLEAELLLFRGDAAAAEARYEEALALQLALAGEVHTRTAEIRAALGRLLGERGELEAAEAQTRRALETRHALFDPDRDVVVATRHNLAVVLLQLGRLDEAEAELAQVVEAWRRAPAPPHEDLAATLSTLGVISAYQERLEDAESHMRAALETYRASEAHSDATLSNHVTNLARVLHDRGELEEAEALAKEGLELRRGALPPDDPRLADSLALLGDLRLLGGDAAGAVQAFEEALPLMEATYGTKHPETVACREALAKAGEKR